MNLFDDIKRQDTGPSSHLEDSFSYYNRSARIGVARIRALLQAWFDRYPADEQGELAARFRTDFYPAFFELFLHEMLLRLGISVTPHPLVSQDTSTRPDFQLVEGVSTAYLEARLARDESSEMTKERRVRGTLYDQINALDIPDYFLHIAELDILSDRQPSARALKRELQDWLKTLDYENLLGRRDRIKSLDELPTWDYRDKALRLRVRAIPVSEAHRGQPGHRPIGVYPMESGSGGSEASLRKALARKGTKYGQLDGPYIIAVNSLSTWGFDRIDQMEALFGAEKFVIGQPDVVGKRNGFWYGPLGPKHTRVSGVLFCQVGPWNLHVAKLCLFHNPFAVHPYRGALTSLPQAIPEQGKMRWVDGVDPGSLFRLEHAWLGE